MDLCWQNNISAFEYAVYKFNYLWINTRWTCLFCQKQSQYKKFSNHSKALLVSLSETNFFLLIVATTSLLNTDFFVFKFDINVIIRHTLFCVWLLLQSVMFVISIMLFRSLIILIAIYFSIVKIGQSLLITVTITGHTVFSNLRVLWLKFLCVCVSSMYISNAKSVQSCPALCNPMDCSLPVSFVHGIFLARILEWVAISSSLGSSQHRNWSHVSCVFHWKVDSLPMSHRGSPKLLYVLCCAVLSCSVVSDSLHSKDCSLPGSSFHGDIPAKNTGLGCCVLLMLLYTSW